MDSLLSVENWFTLAMLVLLQAVLGFDNLLYISIESKRVAPDRQVYVRRVGIAVAIILRIVLLFAILQAIQYCQEAFMSFDLTGILLLSEGGHLSHLRVFGYAIEPMAKSTFYFVLFVLVAVEIVQSRYRKKLEARRAETTGVA